MERKELEEKDLYHGMSVTCILTGTPINDAKISIEENKIHLCQNHIHGNIAKDKLGYTKSYCIKGTHDLEYHKRTEVKSLYAANLETITTYEFQKGNIVHFKSSGIKNIIKIKNINNKYLKGTNLITVDYASFNSHEGKWNRNDISNLRKATKEEKIWFESCENHNKYIPAPKYKVGDILTYLNKDTLPGNNYTLGGKNQAGYKGTLKKYNYYRTDKKRYEIRVTSNTGTYNMLECEFEEWNNPYKQVSPDPFEFEFELKKDKKEIHKPILFLRETVKKEFIIVKNKRTKLV